ncbi:hypothetical protein [Dactylosporangium sp. CS-033363]|uniref:hypothetical protein n=1 Tax=Dactylosporangium sp. CS-033363 TaxID=3239935 RepID=UPI003D91D826
METYKDFRLPELWQIVQGENPEDGFTHITTLNRLRTALEQECVNLRVHRDRLIAGWPPDRSEAAWAFVGRINDMIDVMTQTADAARRISIGVDETYAAIRVVRGRLESLLARYPLRQGQNLVTDDLKNAELDQRGRDALIAADARIVGAAEQINVSPPAYQRFDEQGSAIQVEQAPGAGGPGRPSGFPRAGRGRSAVLQAPVFDPPSPSPGNGPRDGVDLGDGLTLTREPGVSTSVANVGAPPGPPLAPFGSVGGHGSTVLPPATPGGVGVRPGVLGPGGVISAPRPGAATAGPPTAVPMTGGVPRSGAAAPQSVRRGTAAGAGGYRDRSYEQYADRRRARRNESDGNEVWAVREGVPPIIEAPAEPLRHDPGPGVLGIDR